MSGVTSVVRRAVAIVLAVGLPLAGVVAAEARELLPPAYVPPELRAADGLEVVPDPTSRLVVLTADFDPASVVAGGTADLVVTVSAPLAATPGSVQVRTLFSAGLRPLPGGGSDGPDLPEGWTCRTDGGSVVGAFDGEDHLVCEADAGLSAASTVVLRWPVATAVAEGGRLLGAAVDVAIGGRRNPAARGLDEADDGVHRDVALLHVVPAGVAALRVTATAEDGGHTVTVGRDRRLTATVDVRNVGAGPVGAGEDVRVTVAVPPTFADVDVAGTGWACAPRGSGGEVWDCGLAPASAPGPDASAPPLVVRGRQVSDGADAPTADGSRPHDLDVRATLGSDVVEAAVRVVPWRPEGAVRAHVRTVGQHMAGARIPATVHLVGDGTSGGAPHAIWVAAAGLHGATGDCTAIGVGPGALAVCTAGLPSGAGEHVQAGSLLLEADDATGIASLVLDARGGRRTAGAHPVALASGGPLRTVAPPARTRTVLAEAEVRVHPSRPTSGPVVWRLASAPPGTGAVATDGRGVATLRTPAVGSEGPSRIVLELVRTDAAPEDADAALERVVLTVVRPHASPGLRHEDAAVPAPAGEAVLSAPLATVLASPGSAPDGWAPEDGAPRLPVHTTRVLAVAPTDDGATAVTLARRLSVREGLVEAVAVVDGAVVDRTVVASGPDGAVLLTLRVPRTGDRLEVVAGPAPAGAVVSGAAALGAAAPAPDPVSAPGPDATVVRRVARVAAEAGPAAGPPPTRPAPQVRRIADGDPPSGLCALAAAVAGGADSATLGPVLTVSGLTSGASGGGTTCDGATAVALRGVTVTLGGALELTGVGGSVDASGLTFTTAGITLAGLEAFGVFAVDGTVAATWTEVGTLGALGLEAVSESFTLVDLPAAWSPRLVLTLAERAGDGAQTVDLGGVIGPATAAGDGLRLDGPVPLDGTPYAFELSGVALRLGSVAATFGGSIAGTVGATPTVTVAASLDAPVEVVPGVTVERLDVRIDDPGLAGDATVAIATGGTAYRLAGAFAYRAADDWSMELSAAAGAEGAGWQPLPGLDLSDAEVDGALALTADGSTFDVAIDVRGTWSPMPVVSIDELRLEITNACVDGAAPAAGGTCDVRAVLSGRADADLGDVGLPGVDLTAAASGELDLDTGSVLVRADVDPIDLTFVTLEAAAIELAYDPTAPAGDDAAPGAGGPGEAVHLLGSIEVFGQRADAQVELLPTGYVLSADLVGAQPVAGFSFPSTRLFYADATVPFDPSLGTAPAMPALTLPAAVPTIVAPMPLVGEVGELLGPFVTAGWAQIAVAADGTGGSFTAYFEPPADWYLLGEAGAPTSLRIDDVDLAVAVGEAGSGFTLGGTATLLLAGGGGGAPTELDLTLALTMAEVGAGVEVVGSLTLDAPGGWSDAFGMAGLTVYDLVLQAGVEDGLPTFAFEGTATLPPDVDRALGLSDTAVITLAVDLAVGDPCLAFAVSDPTGATAVDIGAGAVTATSGSMVIAPLGCSIGAIAYAPGFSFSFDGAVTGVPTQLDAALTLAPLSLTADADVGRFAVGGVVMEETRLTLAVTTEEWELGFAGGVQVGGTTVQASGDVRTGVDGFHLDLEGSVDEWVIATGTVVEDADLSLSLDLGATTAVALAIDGRMLVAGEPEQVSLDGTMVDGIVQRLDADLELTIDVDDVDIDAEFTLVYTDGAAPVITFAGEAVVSGRELTGVSGTVDGNGVELRGSLDVPGLLAGTLEGSLVWGDDPSQPAITVIGPDGRSTPGAKGDFSFAAEGLSLTLGGFDATGSALLGRLGDDAYLAVAAAVVLGDGRDRISLAGEIESTGAYAFAGSGQLQLAGFALDAQVTASDDGSGDTSITASGDLDVPGVVQVALSGDLEQSAGTTLYTLSGEGVFLLPSRESVSATLSNEPDSAGLWVDISITAGSTLDAEGSLSITPAGVFRFAGAGTLQAGDGPADVDVTADNCGSTCDVVGEVEFHADGTVVAKGFRFAASLDVRGDGAFTATLTIPDQTVHTNFDQQVVSFPRTDVKGSFSVTYGLRLVISDTASSSLSADASGRVSSRVCVVGACGRTSSDSVGVSTRLGDGSARLTVSKRIDGHNVSHTFTVGA